MGHGIFFGCKRATLLLMFIIWFPSKPSLSWYYICLFLSLQWLSKSANDYVKVNYSNFQLSVECNPRWHWFRFIPLCDWSRKLTPILLTNQIRNLNLSWLGHLPFPAFQALYLTFHRLLLCFRFVVFLLPLLLFWFDDTLKIGLNLINLWSIFQEVIFNMISSC